MKINFDGSDFEVTDQTDNIVEIDQQNGIFITAPCFRNEKKIGCCNACIIVADGKEQFACETTPHNGMNVIYNTDYLEKKRKEKLLDYSERLKM